MKMEPGDVQVVKVCRHRGAQAHVRDAASPVWYPLGVAPPPGLYDALLASMGTPRFRPVALDVQVTHGYPEPWCQLLDHATPLDRHLALGVVQLLTTALLRDAHVQPGDQP